ncbi:MAG TPA: biopolymer transporter ExbD [Spirochaetota bacterium]|nr:biopolymer transporter ExbD [Spirochaetota bacterium]HPC42531.1 biopolymer transporter ExbD [Spirochaetota bacterium]HPL15485.1 biopolymer transporter ExbD [Spirochaetota bacterium]HQF10181.1 biopolymer transporter ExbD [Spirochaetota bacterium]HQH98965.1 biopolymer transporter ExbD [Spirochaetota bacterium]
MAHAGNGNRSQIGNINITPMVDILLVLLVIFMVTANFLKKDAVNISLPAAAAADPNVARTVQVALARDGKLYLEGIETSEKEIIARLSRDVKFRPNMRVTLSADENLAYRSIARTMGIIKKAGVGKIALSVKR